MNRPLAKGCFVAVAAFAALSALGAVLPDREPADVAADNVRYELLTGHGEAMGAANVYPLEGDWYGVCGYTLDGAPYAARAAARPGSRPLLFVAGAGRPAVLDMAVDTAADAWCNNGEGLAQ